jgi:hypothetical protein
MKEEECCKGNYVEYVKEKMSEKPMEMRVYAAELLIDGL